MSTSRRVRGFYQLSRSWYRAATMRDGLEEFCVGVYLIEPDDGCDGSFMIKREHLTGTEDAWRLCAFDDAWRILPEFNDVLTVLEKLRAEVSAEDIRAALVACGVVDLTRETR